MSNKITKAIMGGIAGALVMSLIMFILPYIGMPEISTPGMLSVMLGTSVAVGWIIHLAIGVIFSLVYAFLIIKILRKIKNDILKGLIFGVLVFIIGQAGLAIMGPMMNETPALEGSMAMIMATSIIAHIFYGLVVVLYFSGRRVS